MPGRKAAEQCRGMQAMVALEACADGDTLDQTLECAWLCPPSFALPASPLSFSLLLQTILRREQREERPSRGGGTETIRVLKPSELPTAKPLSRQREARRPLPSQAFQPHQPWQKAGRTIILTIWPNRWPHSKTRLSLQHRIVIDLPVVLIAAQLARPRIGRERVWVNKWLVDLNF